MLNIDTMIWKYKKPGITLVLFIIFTTVSVWLVNYIVQQAIKASIQEYTETVKISENYECGLKRVSYNELKESIRIMNRKTNNNVNVEKLITGIALKKGGRSNTTIYTLPQNIEVTYAFRDRSTSISDSEFDEFERIVNTKINPFVNITFVRISVYDDADLKIQFKARTGPDTGAWAYIGVGFYGHDPGMEYDSRIFTERRYNFFKQTCIIHEFGHILSLGHEFLGFPGILHPDNIYQKMGCYSGKCAALGCNSNTNIFDVMDSCNSSSPICPNVCSSMNRNVCKTIAKQYTMTYSPSRYSRFRDVSTFVRTSYDSESIMGYRSIPSDFYCNSSDVYAGNQEFSAGDKELLAILYPLKGTQESRLESQDDANKNKEHKSIRRKGKLPGILVNILVIGVMCFMCFILIYWFLRNYRNRKKLK